MPITRFVAAMCLYVVVGVLSVSVICTFVIPPIHFLFSTVAKALLLALAGA